MKCRCPVPPARADPGPGGGADRPISRARPPEIVCRKGSQRSYNRLAGPSLGTLVPQVLAPKSLFGARRKKGQMLAYPGQPRQMDARLSLRGHADRPIATISAQLPGGVVTE